MTAPAPLCVLLGETASGKESAAFHAALRLDAEIVVCDSVKPYRGLGIASAAPPADHAARVPHHLVGELEPTERLDAARWLELAEAAVAEVRSRGRVPLVVGGTALYLKALLFGLFEGPPRDPELRRRLGEQEDADPGRLHARLSEVDPVAAARLHRNDRKRLLRALEVHALTGRPISELQREWSGGASRAAVVVGLRRAREDLHERIARRVRRMVSAGLCDEVRELVRAGRLGPTAAEAIGVKELVPVLEDEAVTGRLDPLALERALEAVERNTRLLAKRQRTWWKRFPGVVWLDVAPDEDPEATGARVAGVFGPAVADLVRRRNA